MTHAGRWPAAAVWTLMLTMSGETAGPATSAIPQEDYPKLVAQQTKVLVDALKAAPAAQPIQQRRLLERARAAAIVLAQAAQDNLGGADANQRLALRDEALAIIKLLPSKEPKTAEALKRAEGLASLKPTAGGPKDRVALLPAHTDLETVMVPFKNADKGGQDLEKLLIKLSFDKKKNIPASQQGDPLLLALYQTALLAELTRDHKVEKDGKKWTELSDDMRRTALEMAGSIRAKDGKAAFAALTRLNTSCTACHEAFRDNGQ